MYKKFIPATISGVAALALSLGTSTSEAQLYPNAVAADHPIAYWRLQETGGAVAHDSAGAYNGGFTNVLLGQPGYRNGADPAALAVGVGGVASQANNSYVGGISLDLSSSANTNFSVEAWVNSGGVIGGAGIVGKGTGNGGEEFFLDCGGPGTAFRFFIRNAAGTAFNASGTIQPDGNWHHLVGVCDELNGRLLLYVDGQSNAVNTSVAGGIRASSNPYLSIGSRQSGTGPDYDQQFSGYISDVAIYNYSLSATQVVTHYLAAGIAPVITLQPAGSVVTNEGATVSLPAAAFGSSPLSYQWTANGIPLTDQTNATLLLTNISASLNGAFVVLTVTNAYGSASTFGTSFSINSGAPQITSDVQPTEIALYTGLPKTYSVGVSGSVPFYYQWQQNGAAIPGGTTSSYTVNTLAGTNTYSVVVSNSFGGGSVANSSTATLIGVTAPTATYATHILADHPVAYWRLGETNSATMANDFAGGHNGTYNSTQLGVPGYSPLFDPDTAAGFGSLAPTDSYVGENDNSSLGLPLVDFAQPAGSNSAFSVEAWVNGGPTQNASGSGIVAKGGAGSEQFLIDASGPGNHFRFVIRKPNGGGTSSIFSGGSVAPDNTWHHLVGVCDEPGGAMYFYVDGANQGTITGIGGAGINSSPIPLSIGAQFAGADYAYQFAGTIDEVAVYNYALSASQVQDHYGAAPVPPYFTSVPTNEVIAYVGQSVTLSASALGSVPRTNQWFVNGTTMANQTNLSLSLTNVQVGTNTYTIRVSNAFGAVTNLPGTVVEVAAGSGPPQINADIKPISGTFYAGLPLSYSVGASGSAPLAYQWFFNDQPLSGATSSSLAFARLDATNAGTYYLRVTNALGSINSSTTTLAVVSAPTSPYSLTVMSDHPVAYFRLDETAGSTTGYDYVGGNVGYYSNVIYQVPGAFGSFYGGDPAVYFGTNNVQNSLLGDISTNVDFSVPNGQNGAFSVEAWAKGPTGINQLSGGGIVAKGVGNGDEQFALDAHFGFRFYVRNTAGVTVAGAQASPLLGGTMVGGNWQMDGQWHQVVGVCDQAKSNILMYVDGTLIGPNVITNGVVPPLVFALDQNIPSTGTNGVIFTQAGVRKPSNANWNANTVSIGSRNRNSSSAGYTLNFIGGVDEVSFYNYALSPLQVSNHFAVAKDLPISLSIQEVNGRPTLTWPATFATATLQSAPSVTGAWSTVPNASSPYTVTNSTSQQFFRLKLF